MKNGVTVIGLYGMSLLLGMETFPQDGQTVVACSMAVEPGGMQIGESIRRATMAASLSVTRQGVIQAIPALQELDRFIDEQR